MSTNTAVQTATPAGAVAKAAPRKTIRDVLSSEGFKGNIIKSLPKHCQPDRFVRIALMATVKNPKLLECTEESMLQCCYQLSSLGLEPDGRRAHLIPFNNTKKGVVECTTIVDYKGIVELVRNSKEVSYIMADVVCENDDFDFTQGTGAFLRHKPNFKGERGNIVCAYSFVKLKDGSEDFRVMSVPDIQEIQKRSKSANAGPWVTDWAEMAKKTVFRNHSKWLPFSPEIREAIEKDDDVADDQRFHAAKALKTEVITDRPSFLAPAPAALPAPEVELPPADNVDEAAEAEAGLAPQKETVKEAEAPAPTAAPAPAPEATGAGNPLAQQLVNVLIKHKVTEAQFCKWATVKFKAINPVPSVDAFVEMSPKRTATLIEKFDLYLPEIRQAK